MLGTNFIEAVTERDIDLLLLEEIYSSPAFRSWLRGNIFGPGSFPMELEGVWHSLTHPALGESDLVIVEKDPNGWKRTTLIENKIDAPPQPQQAQRYAQRGEVGITEGKWREFRTCIVAPERYLLKTADADGYDAQVSYESIREWLHRSHPDDVRFEYKARLIDEAIEHNRRGYQPTPHEGVTQFWHRYWELVNSEFPQLFMKEPGKVPENSDWPEFRNLELGDRRKIVHKWRFGVVDLQIDGAGDAVDQIREANEAALDGDVEVVRTHKSASIRVFVPIVDRRAEFSAQIGAVRTGLSAAVRLLHLSPEIEWDYR